MLNHYTALLEKIQDETISINKTHEMIKVSESKRKIGEVDVPAKNSSNAGKDIKQDSLCHFILI